eukprot:m.102816 g.102816  ORF g.102816 m.102816 type:complete len:79 (+) comp13787_c0_seq3:242-478(+)
MATKTNLKEEDLVAESGLVEVKKGSTRGVYAQKAVPPGTVMMVSFPAAATVLGDLRGSRCSWCLRPGTEDGGNRDSSQ